MVAQILLDGFSVLAEKWPVVFGAVLSLCIGCYLVFHLSTKVAKTPNSPSALLLPVLVFAFSVILRFAFITRTYVPPYFDSVEHYRLIRELIKGISSTNFLGTFTGLTPGYYHLGYHVFASLLTFGLRADPIDVILILGQGTLAAIPIPLYFFLQYETKSTSAAFLGMILAGFGWYMPGFAVNWGKYPAIAGLLAFELVLGIAYFVTQKTNKGRFLWFIVLILGTITSTFIHSRTFIIIAIAFGSWFLAGWIRSFSRVAQYYSTGILMAGILILVTFIYKEPLLKLALEPYLEDGLWVTTITLLPVPFAWLKFPRGVYFSLLFMLGVFASLFISLKQILPGYENQTLLDRPFVEMLLYFPMSILAGLGLAGLLQYLGELKSLPEQMQMYVKNLAAVLVIGIVGIISMKNYDFYPSDCCNFLGYDDTIAMDWLSRNTPGDARILVPSTEMNVLPSGPTADTAGTDAGVWIPNLASRQIILMPYSVDFRSTDAQEQLCQKEVDYIYVGKTNQSFDGTLLQTTPDRYKGVLRLSTVQLYQLAGCSPTD